MSKNNYTKKLYNISINLVDGIYEEKINGRIYKIIVGTDYRGSIVRIYCDNKKVYQIYKNLDKIKVYFNDYTITKNIDINEYFDKEIAFNNKEKVYITETKVGNNGMWADFNKETNELRYLINKKMELRYDFNNNKIHLFIIDKNNKTIINKIEYNHKFIEKFNKLLESNKIIFKEELNDINLDILYDENIKYLTDKTFLDKFIETVALFKTYSIKLDDLQDAEINVTVYKFIEKLNKDIKYARINALNYYIKNNDLRDPLILKEVYNEIKSIYKSKDNKRKLIKTRKTLKEYNDIEH